MEKFKKISYYHEIVYFEIESPDYYMILVSLEDYVPTSICILKVPVASAKTPIYPYSQN